LETKYWYLLINHFYNELQKVKGKVGAFIELKREITFNVYSYENVKSRRKQPLKIALVFSLN